jgi:acyl-CoA thioester hydrolase
MQAIARPFSHPLRVRWAESDPQGIVFNGHYLTYFDVGITEFMRAAGVAYPDGLTPFGVDMLMVHAEVDYKSPARFDDEIEVVVSDVHAGNTSVTFELGVLRDTTELARGRLVYVIADPHSHEPKPVPDALKEALGA